VRNFPGLSLNFEVFSLAFREGRNPVPFAINCSEPLRTLVRFENIGIMIPIFYNFIGNEFEKI